MQATLDWLFGEDRCTQCHAPTASVGLCAGCLHALPWNDDACPRCALPLRAGHCPDCARRPPGWAAAHCALRFEAPVRDWLHGLKYHGRLALARRLADLLAVSLHGSGFHAPELLVPAPMHRSRLRHRGFNQAVELAARLGRRLRLPSIPGAVRQHRATGDQTTLSAAQRRRNLRGAFTATPALVAGRHVTIVDDVLTTGATAAALTDALHRAGAARVEVWCCARTP